METFEASVDLAEKCLDCGGVKWSGAECALCELKKATATIGRMRDRAARGLYEKAFGEGLYCDMAVALKDIELGCPEEQ